MHNVDYIKMQLGKTELLLGLTEEALELALAALKLRRVLDGSNPTPISEEQAVANLLEEYGDVLNSVEVIVTPTQHETAMQSRFRKRNRWVRRLKERPDRERIYREILEGCKSHLQNATTSEEIWDALKNGLSKLPDGTYDQLLLNELKKFVQADRATNAQAYMLKIIPEMEYIATCKAHDMVDATIERLRREQTPT